MCMERDPQTRKTTRGPTQRNANTSPLPQEQQRLSRGVFGGHEVKKEVKDYEERMEKKEEKLWKSRGVFF